VTSFETGTETLYKVQVKINNASSIKGFAKYEDLIPAGFTVTGMFSDFGNATFDSEKAEVTFISLNQRDEVTITYYLQGELQFKPSSVSTFSYVSGEEMSRLKITE
jgi:predicted DNA-binding protein with PD1-like motif